MAAYPPEVAALIEELLAGIRDALGDSFVGAYLCGSLALGAFDPDTSDVDILIVTEKPLSDAEFGAVRALHKGISPDDNQYRVPYDVTYIDRSTVRRFDSDQRHVKVGHGEPLHRGDHRPNWVLERWMVRERGVTLLGPNPKLLIDPVSSHEICEAAIGELRRRLQHWLDGTWPRRELLHRSAQGFEIETACRALHTHETGELSSKDQATAWALERLPAKWRPLIAWSRQHRKDRTPDDGRIDEVIRFVRWAATRRTPSRDD